MANLVTVIEKDKRRYSLALSNNGSAHARNIQIRMDGRPFREHVLVPGGQAEVSELGAGAKAEYLLAPHMTTPDVVEVEITWDDESGEPGRWKSRLRV